MASNGRTTAYDAAVAAAGTQAEKDRLRDLRLRFNVPPDSPEWQFYAVLAPLLTSAHERRDLAAQLDRIEARLQKAAPSVKPPPIVVGPTRDLIIFTVALLTCVAVAVVSAGAAPLPPFATVVAAFVLGVAVAFGYLWLGPIIARVRR